MPYGGAPFGGGPYGGGGGGYTAQVADSWSISDQAVAVTQRPRSVGDGWGVTDSASATSGYPRAAGDGFAFTDAGLINVHDLRGASDGFSLSDLVRGYWAPQIDLPVFLAISPDRHSLQLKSEGRGSTIRTEPRGLALQEVTEEALIDG